MTRSLVSDTRGGTLPCHQGRSESETFHSRKAGKIGPRNNSPDTGTGKGGNNAFRGSPRAEFWLKTGHPHSGHCSGCTFHEIASRMIQRTDFEWSVVHQLSGHREGLRNRESCIQLPMQRKRPARHRCCSHASPQF